MYKEIISIIVPTYNSSLTIRRCVLSILNQSFSQFGIYIIDDNSSDDTWDIVQCLAKSDDRIKIFRNQSNLGPSCSRNLGLSESMGEWVCFIDSDDYIDKDFLKYLYCNNHCIADIIIGSFFQVDDNGVCIRKYIAADYYNSKTALDALDKAYGRTEDLEFVYNLCCNKLYRKSLFDKVRFPAGRLQEDAFIMPFLFYNTTKPIVAVPEALYYYVNNYKSISHEAQYGGKDMSRRIDLVYLYENHIRLYKYHLNPLYKRSRANLLNNVIALFRMHYNQLQESRKSDFRNLRRIFRKHYLKALFEKNPYLTRNLLLSWILFVISPSLYLKYI